MLDRNLLYFGLFYVASKFIEFFLIEEADLVRKENIGSTASILPLTSVNLRSVRPCDRYTIYISTRLTPLTHGLNNRP